MAILGNDKFSSGREEKRVESLNETDKEEINQNNQLSPSANQQKLTRQIFDLRSRYPGLLVA